MADRIFPHEAIAAAKNVRVTRMLLAIETCTAIVTERPAENGLMNMY